MEKQFVTIRREDDGLMCRAVVMIHEAALRDIHATPWCGTWERAMGWARRYCAKNGLTIAYSD